MIMQAALMLILVHKVIQFISSLVCEQLRIHCKTSVICDIVVYIVLQIFVIFSAEEI